MTTPIEKDYRQVSGGLYWGPDTSIPQHNEFKGKTLGEIWDPSIKHQNLIFNPDWALVTLDGDASHAPTPVSCKIDGQRQGVLNNATSHFCCKQSTPPPVSLLFCASVSFLSHRPWKVDSLCHAMEAVQNQDQEEME